MVQKTTLATLLQISIASSVLIMTVLLTDRRPVSGLSWNRRAQSR
jgi:hypothetical protein